MKISKPARVSEQDRRSKVLRMTTAPAVIEETSLLEGPPDPELIRIRDLIYQTAGIFHPDNKLRLLSDRCSRRMKHLQLPSLREYSECLTIRRDRQTELVELLNQITIGETCFFRNPAQLDALRRIVLPKIVSAEPELPSRHLRIWSAGCSTGEEPFTLSILMHEETRDFLKNWTYEILATDLNENSLSRARNGAYDSYSTRHLTPQQLQKYFQPNGELFQIKPDVRKGVSFSRLNLIDEPHVAFMKNLDVIFCCNVLIYFDLASKRRVIQQLFKSLKPQGYLFLGHSESLYGLNSDFRLVHFPGATAYLKDGKTPGSRCL
jgi:chemotaxis protein methyltransferase CheR